MTKMYWAERVMGWFIQYWMGWPLELGQGRHWLVRLMLLPVFFIWLVTVGWIGFVLALPFLMITIFHDWGEGDF